jgi:hypothetical protein
MRETLALLISKLTLGTHSDCLKDKRRWIDKLLRVVVLSLAARSKQPLGMAKTWDRKSTKAPSTAINKTALTSCSPWAT